MCQVPAIRQVVGECAKESEAASTNQLGRLATETLTLCENLPGLMDLPRKWIHRVNKRRPGNKLILDLDSSVSPTHGHKEGTAYNGHFGCTCYHSLFCFNQHGDLERVLLRKGNVHTAEDWRSVLEPVFVRYHGRLIIVFFRGARALPRWESMNFLTTRAIRTRSSRKAIPCRNGSTNAC